MKKELNIAKILKDKPKGVSLYSSVFGNCIYRDNYDNCIEVVTDNCYYFNEKGHYITNSVKSENGECLLFPSKSMRNWHKFAWKKGDILVNKDGDVHIIFERFEDNTYSTFIGKHYLWEARYDEYQGSMITSLFSKAKEEDAQTYINTIEERLGGKLNRETLEVEKAQPEFNDGDIAFADYGNRQDVFIVSDKTNLSEGYDSFISLDLRGTLSMGHRTSFFKKDLCKLRLATEEEKQKLFSALAKEGKVWIPEKKQIVDLKPKVKLKPFDKVLVRDFENQAWTTSFFGFKDAGLYFCCNGRSYQQCIPYEGNEHLLGTTKDVEE